MVCEMGWPWVAGSTWNFSKAKKNSHKPCKFNATFIVSYPENSISKFLDKLVGMDGSKVLFLG